MVDTQTDFDWYGVFYICSFCVLEMAETYGAASPSRQLDNLATLESVERDRDAARERLQKAEGILNALGAGHLIDAVGTDYSDVSVSSEVTPEAPEPIGDGNSDGPFDSGEGEQPETDERPVSERPDDFFGADGSDDDLSSIFD
jgi:hypothetical protein